MPLTGGTGGGGGGGVSLPGSDHQATPPRINPIDDGLQDLNLPVPVQTFLWQQIAPFIRPKLGKLHEASCMFCQHAPGHHELKEACKSFEKVLAQNIQFGLSPSLTAALESIPRWRILQAALPHLMHACSTLLHTRVKDMHQLGAAETKLLYTLHWIFLSAADECQDEEMQMRTEKKPKQPYLFSVPTISLFVYLFAPIAHHLKESDFANNVRLENGIKFWQGMWEFRSPGAPCFTAPVKPKARQSLNSVSSATSAEIFPGNGRKQSEGGPDFLHSPPSTFSDTPKHDDDVSWVSSPKDFVFPETIPEEASSIEEERVVIFRLPPGNHTQDPTVYNLADASLLHQSCGGNQKTRFDFEKALEKHADRMRREEPKPKTSTSTEKESLETDTKSANMPHYDVNAATFLDVAVLRCLFNSHWQEEGVYWGLHYLNNRLREINEEATLPPSQPRRRSNSLPIPQIEVSLYQGPNSDKGSPSNSSAQKEYIEIPEPPVIIDRKFSDDIIADGRRGSEKKKRVKMSDLRTLIETRILSKSDRGLEKIGLDANGKDLQTRSDNHRSLDASQHHLVRSASLISREPTSNLIKGKSMPSLSNLLDTGFHRYVEPQRIVRSTEKCQDQRPLLPRNPIITVTEHTPTPSPDYMRRQSFKGSFDSQLDAISTAGSVGAGFKAQMLRSHTDSHIAYGGIDEQEVPGSTFFITKEGGIDYEIILLAVYNVFKRDANICSLRVLETGLNVCELLLELGAVKLGEHAHHLSMGIIRRALLHLGCPHGCNEGIRGPPAEFLRTQCHSMLSRLLRQLSSLSKKYLRCMVRTSTLTELVEFFHAFVGFCIDPSSLLSPLNHKRPSILIKTLQSDLLPTISGGQGGYATNFGSGLSGSAESQVIAAVFRALVSRFVDSTKVLKATDNMGLFCDVRQLITYVKGAHGGTFRRVALSGILAVCNRPHMKPPARQTTRVIRHISQMDIQNYQSDDRSQRKCIFKKRSASSTCAFQPSFLETDLLEEPCITRDSPGIMKRKGNRPVLTPRQSERALLSDSTSSSDRGQPPGKLSGIVRWFRGSRERCSVDIESAGFGQDVTTSFSRKSSISTTHLRNRQPDGFGRSLQRARRRVERRLGRFGIGKGKKKMQGIDDSTGSCFSRRSSYDITDGPRDTEVVILKERYLIPTEPLREGMLRFSFLLETCAPGSVPDPQLIAAVLDLPNAPIIARATLLIECSHFVHLCNRGQWPAWMKQTLPAYRPSVAPNIGANHRASVAASARRIHILQRASGKMFHQWAEAIGHRLEELVHIDKANFDQSNVNLNDFERQKQLIQQDEEEDFLDDASVNSRGNECPPALKLVACIVLLEISAFLRETYQSLPKAARLSTKENKGPWEKAYRDANRRWSMAFSSMQQSHNSAQSLQSIAGAEGPNERKISFVLHEPENESEGSSNTTLTLQGEEREARRPVQPVRPFLLRRGTAVGTGGSFKRRSLKLRRGTKDSKEIEADYQVKRTDSIQSRRKVSSLSDRSDNSEIGQQSGGEESPGILSDEQPPESPSADDTDDTGKNFPWMKAVIEVINSFNFYCTHQNYCHPYCYRRHMRAATRLMTAVRKVHGEEFGLVPNAYAASTEQAKMSGRRERSSRGGRKESDRSASQMSPSKRKDSLGKKDKIVIDEEANATLLAQTLNGKKPKETSLILKYIKNHVRDLFHVPMAIILKTAPILTEDQFIEIIPSAWEFLLESDQELATASAAVFILGSVKASACTTEIMQRVLKHKDPSVRIGGILRYQVLWKSRFQVWSRMEDTAHMSFKVPPPGIEFTLPSPKIGIESLPVVDPPWSLQRSQSMEVTLDQERDRSLVTATKTRKRQQTEAIKHALQLQEDKQRAERQSFLITTIAITQQAAHAPGIDHTPSEDHTEEDDDGTRAALHLQHAAHSLFPSCLCSSVMLIVASLDDAQVSNDGIAVYEVAYQVIWTCLVEDSALFLRFVLEKLTRDKQDQMFKLLRHLIRFVPRLPQQAAFALYNYLIGYVMFYVRSSHENGMQLVGSALSIIWMIVHSVHGIMFKDLKQILRKEQCDASILLTANVPSAKRIVVHPPEDAAVAIPQQFQIQEDTQFIQLYRESYDYFDIDANSQGRYFLVDYKTYQILNPNWYCRDLYFFKRSQYPQIRLIEMSPEDAFLALQRQEVLRKFVEIGKVHLTWAILKNVDMVVQRVVFLHEELMKLPSFPRKALEADLDLYQGGEFGKELLGLDVLHKFMWVRLIARMFEAMAGNFAYAADIQLFLNVLSGAALLHSEDSCIMRYVMATFINAAFNFKNIFSTSGYFMIMPTLLQIYSLHQTNKLVTTTIEYAVKQFYLMNRKPFILQMFGAVSSILDTDEDGWYGEAHKVQSSCLFNLLLSLETPSPDPLNIAELVKEPKPLKAIDFCYHDEDEMVGVMDCITLCVMTVSYAAESTRGYQMLVILEAILPCYLQQIQSTSYIPLEGKCERDIILQLAICVRTMVHNCEGLSKSYNGPYRNSPEHKGSSQRNCSRGPPCSPGLEFEEESHSKYVSDRGMTKTMLESVEDSEQVRTEYRRPRDVLLSVVGDFLSRSTTRLQELSKKPGADNKPVEILDIKCHMRLADIAHSLLKVSPYDPESMGCRGLQRYMQSVLPRADWGDEKMRQSLNKILLRLDKVFLKITKKPSIRRITNWEYASGLLKGIHETIARYSFVLHWQQMRDLLAHLMNLIINEPGTSEAVSSAGAALMSQHPPPSFCSTVIRLVALQLISPVESFNLKQMVGGHSEFSSQEKAERHLLHLIMPLCLKICSGKGVSETGELKQADISFMVTVVLNAMSPPAGRTAQIPVNKVGADIRAGSLTFTGSRDAKRPAKIANSLYQAAFLALRVLCVSFESRLANEWPRIVRVMRDLGRRNEAATVLWSFLEFTVTHRTPLYICLMPFVLHKINHPPIGDHERHMQFLIRERIRGVSPEGVKSRGALLLDLARELRDLKDLLEERRYDRDVMGEPMKKDVAVTIPTADTSKQRPSLISLITGQGPQTSGQPSTQLHDSRSGTGGHTPSDTLSQNTLNPPHSSSSNTTNKEPGVGSESQSTGPTPSNSLPTSTTVIPSNAMGGSVPHLPHSSSLQQNIKSHPPRLRFVQSVEFRHSSGERSITPLSPESPAEESSGETQRPHRLQRSKAQSRKTFRLKRTHPSQRDLATPQPESPGGPTTSAIAQASSTTASTVTLTAANVSPQSIPTPPPATPAIKPVSDVSWDSVSQTSSTSGYRDNYSFQIGYLSPDDKSGSQNSLLMLFEAEDTLI